MKAALYLRCSKSGDLQNPEVQLGPLQDLAGARGWQIHRVYCDRASGAAEDRPELMELLDDARRGAFGVVAVWRFDRFARSAKQLVLALEEFQALGIEFVSHQEALDTTSPMGKAMFTVIAAMAELERSLIRERVKAGLEHAKQRGTRSGKAIGRPLKVFRRDEIVQLREEKHLSWSKIAARLGVSVGTVFRIGSTTTGPAAQRLSKTL